MKHTGLFYMHFWHIDAEDNKNYIYDLDIDIDEVLRPMIEDWVWDYIEKTPVENLVDVGFNVDPYNGSVIDYCIETKDDCPNPLDGFYLNKTVSIDYSKYQIVIKSKL